MNMDQLLGIASGMTVAVHLLWLVWVILGAAWTRNRPALATFHIASVLWGIAVELGPWPCPLTLLEEYFERGSDADSHPGGFVVHYLNGLVYPDLPVWLVTTCGVAVCLANLSIYAWRYGKLRKHI